MERAIKRGMLVFFVAMAVFLILGSTLEVVSARSLANEKNTNQPSSLGNIPNSSTYQTVLPSTDLAYLPDFLLKLSEYLSRGNASELSRIRKEMITQEKLNHEISHENPPQAAPGSLQLLDSYNTGYLMDIRDKSPDMYTPVGYPYPPGSHVLIGQVDDEWGATGSGPNYWGAYYEATGWYNENGEYTWGEALTWGAASQPYVGLAEFHITAKKGPLAVSYPPWYNYLIIMVADDDLVWHWVNYVEVHSGDWQDYTIGSININFKYISVFSTCPGGWPFEKSSLYVDNVYYVEYYRQVTLTVTSGEGGTTDPSSPITVWQYQQPEVTAYANPYYGFDHWEEDGINIGGSNPIWIYMDDDHTLHAVFHTITEAWLTIDTRDDAGYPVDANLYVDGNGVGFGSASVYLSLGTHYIDADNYVWDEYYQTYVFPVSGIGQIDMTGDTYVVVHYTY